jgi:hypothetical protein
VLLTDGKTNTSLLPYSEVLTLVRQSGIAAYAISLAQLNLPALNDTRFLEAQFNLREVADESGARWSSQYALGFVAQKECGALLATAGKPIAPSSIRGRPYLWDD